MKVSVGKVKHNSKKFPHQSVDVNTTSDFGFMQPMCGCVELIPNSTLVVQHKGFVRLHTMAAPTFGRVSARCYHYFVPIPDIWHPFENLISSQPYNGVGDSYIPTAVPSVPNKTWIGLLMCMSYCSVYSYTKDRDGNFTNLQKLTGSQRTSAIEHGLIPYNDLVIDNTSFSDNPYFTILDDFSTRAGGHWQELITTPSNADYIYYDSSNVFCFKLNKYGRNIRKVLIGLGYKINYQSNLKSILPIFAYLKCYFDHWYPQRNITWKNTTCYKFLETIEQYNCTSLADFSQHNILTEFYKSIFSLGECYYYQDPDYFSSQFSSLVNNTVSDSFGVPSAVGPRVDVGQMASTNLPQLSNESTPNNALTSARIKALNFLTKYVNKHSVIGGRIDAWLKSQFGAEYVQKDDSYYIGEDSFQVDLSEVMSTSGTTEVNLGEYGGQGKGYSAGDKLKVHAKTYGYYINMFVVVPLTRYNQGSNPNLNHLSKFDFYHSGLDGLTLLPTPKDTLFAVENFNNSKTGDLSQSFGFQSIYQEYKNFGSQNILNGDMSLSSTRDTYRPYYLDRELSESRIVESTSPTGAIYSIVDGMNSENLVASINWRSIGLYPELGNYNRIFLANSRDSDDEHIVRDDSIISQNIFEYDLIAPMLEYRESLDTDGFENGLTIEHS